jgi:hypothetical protein
VQQAFPSAVREPFARYGALPQGFVGQASLNTISIGQPDTTFQLQYQQQQQQQQALQLQQLQEQELLQLQFKEQQLQLQQQQQQQQLWELSAASQRLGPTPVEVLQVAAPMPPGLSPPLAARSLMDPSLSCTNQGLDVLMACTGFKLPRAGHTSASIQLPSQEAAAGGGRPLNNLKGANGRPLYAPSSSLYLQHKRNHAAAATAAAAAAVAIGAKVAGSSLPLSGAVAVAAAMEATPLVAAARTQSNTLDLQLGSEPLKELQVLLQQSNLLLTDSQRINLPALSSGSSSIALTSQQQQQSIMEQQEHDQEELEGEGDSQADGKGAAWKNKKMNVKLYKVSVMQSRIMLGILR